MKRIIDIIKETSGTERVIARYNKDKECNLDVGIMDKDIPEVGETLTDGNQEMTVVEHVVIDGSVGIKFDNHPSVIADSQILQMIEAGIVRIKEG